MAAAWREGTKIKGTQNAFFSSVTFIHMTEMFLLHAVGAKWEQYKIRVQALSFFFKRLGSVLEFCQRFGCFSVSHFHPADEAGM